MTNVFKGFLVLFLFPAMAFGQILNDTVVQYNRLINRAELSICDSNFVDADSLYAEAFKLNPDKTFNYDLFTAFHCAMDADDYEAAEDYLKKLLARGIDSGFLDMGVLSFYSGKEKEIIDNIIIKYPNNVNRNDSLNSAINKLGHRDQEVRVYYSYKSKNGNYMNKSVYEVDSENAHQLFQLIRVLGHFPNVNEISSEGGFPLAGTYADLILQHNLQNYFVKGQKFMFDSVLYQAIQTFDYSTKRFAILFSRCYLTEKEKNNFHYKNVPIAFPVSIIAYKDVEDGGKVYFETLSNDEENRINSEREKLGLGTLKDLRKKVYFDYLQHLYEGKYFAFGGTSVVTYLLSTHEQIKKDLNKALHPIQEYQP